MFAPFDPGSATSAAGRPNRSGGFFATAGTAPPTPRRRRVSPSSAARSQVLAILYRRAWHSSLTSGTTSGGFFPSGVNGNIKTI